MAIPLRLPEAQKDKFFLIVCLTAISDESRTALESRVCDVLSTSKPDAAKAPCFVYARAHSTDRVGEIADIFELAQLAKKANWPELAVFDTLSLQQLEGNTRNGEESDLTFVLVGLRQSVLRKVLGPNGIGDAVLAMRRGLDSTVDVLASEEPDMRLAQWGGPEHGFSFLQKYWHMCGLAIWDPHRPPFSSDEATSLDEERYQHYITLFLNQQPALPSEIKLHIRRYMSEDVALECLTTAPPVLEWNKDNIEVHVLAYQTERELEMLQDDVNSVLRPYDSKSSCTLYPWRKLEPASRLEVFRLAHRLRFHEGEWLWMRLLLFLYPDCWYRHQKLGLVTLGGDMTELITLHEISLQDAHLFWYRRWLIDNSYSPGKNRNAMASFESLNDDFEESVEHGMRSEILYNPHSRFFHDVPPWATHPNAVDGYSDLLVDEWPRHAPLFFLTRYYSSEESNALNESLAVSALWGERMFNYVPWEHEFDGNIEDMWKLFYHVHYYPNTFDVTSDIIFVDRQSFSDGTVIVVFELDTHDLEKSKAREEGRYDSYRPTEPEKLAGIHYIRVPATEAYRFWLNLDDTKESWKGTACRYQPTSIA